MRFSYNIYQNKLRKVSEEDFSIRFTLKKGVNNEVIERCDLQVINKLVNSICLIFYLVLLVEFLDIHELIFDLLSQTTWTFRFTNTRWTKHKDHIRFYIFLNFHIDLIYSQSSIYSLHFPKMVVKIQHWLSFWVEYMESICNCFFIIISSSTCQSFYYLYLLLNQQIERIVFWWPVYCSKT